MTWRDLSGKDKTTIVVAGVGLLLVATFWGTVFAVAWHFVAKWW